MKIQPRAEKLEILEFSVSALAGGSQHRMASLLFHCSTTGPTLISPPSLRAPHYFPLPRARFCDATLDRFSFRYPIPFSRDLIISALVTLSRRKLPVTP